MKTLPLISTAKELLQINTNSTITKRNLFDLIQFSKVEDSNFWCGKDFRISNTPQQGINWVGIFPEIKAVILKVKKGIYQNDGWIGPNQEQYKYSFKARKGKINHKETANLVLLNQQKHQYPILLFIENNTDRSLWDFNGYFGVTKTSEQFVFLNRIKALFKYKDHENIDFLFREGSVTYKTHLSRERNLLAVNFVKANRSSKCNICNLEFREKYGEHYIEAHHINPISNYNKEYTLDVNDLVLLCPNCHKAVHIYMRKHELNYEAIKNKLQQFLSNE